MSAVKTIWQASLLSALIVVAAGCKEETPATPPAPETSAAAESSAPNEKLDTDEMVARSYSEGLPGSAVTAVETLTATVVDIDREKRLAVLQDEAGHRRQVQVPPEAVNFDQVEVGDRIKVVAAVETVVSVNEPGTAGDEVSGVAAQAEEGEQPGAFVAERTQVTAKIEAIDTEKRTATLTFADGSSRTVPVRDDVVMSQDYVGKEVVIVITTALAASVEKLEAAPAN